MKINYFGNNYDIKISPLPKNCSECPFYNAIPDTDDSFCALTEDFDYRFDA